MRENDFDRLLKVLRREPLDEPVLYEYRFNNSPEANKRLVGYELPNGAAEMEKFNYTCLAFKNAGYDYITYRPGAFSFKAGKREHLSTTSLNDGAVIFDRDTFKSYSWPDVNPADYSIFSTGKSVLPKKMKVILNSPGGIRENATNLLGFDNLCMLIYDDPGLLKAIFNAIGERILEHFKQGIQYDAVGGIMYNDDWGFNTGPFFSPDFFEEYIFPWVRKITSLAHQNGKIALIHSCGNMDVLMDTIIDDLKFDGKHSFEDKIMPIEKAYNLYKGRIALLGGIDMDFLARSPKETIITRCKNMLALGKTGYALGSGNTITEYIPVENYFAMISAAGI